MGVTIGCVALVGVTIDGCGLVGVTIHLGGCALREGKGVVLITILVVML